MKKLIILAVVLFTSVMVKAQTAQNNKNVSSPNPPAKVTRDDGYNKWNSAMDRQAKEVQSGKKTVTEGRKEINKAPAAWRSKRAYKAQ